MNRLPTGHIGAISELIVAADMLRRGYQVFRSVSPTGIDLIRYREGKYQRVEVRSRNGTGQPWTLVSERDKDKFDIFACVLPDKTILYYTHDTIFRLKAEWPDERSKRFIWTRHSELPKNHMEDWAKPDGE